MNIIGNNVELLSDEIICFLKHRYDELKIERENLYKKAIPYLEKVFELESDNLNAARTLRNIFSALDETESYNKYKVIVAELENR